MRTEPPVSVCLVTYNRERLLPVTIDSLLAQSFGDFELLISDDCSTDGTQDVCREYERRDSRILYRRNSVNLGMPGNLNVSLQAANGRYLANVHDGDVYRPDLISRWKKALDHHPSAGFVFNPYRSWGKDGCEVIHREPFPPFIPGRELGTRLLSRWGSCVYGTVMARREVYEKMGWFDPRFGNFSDVDMWLRIAREYDVAYVNEPLIELMPIDPSRFYSFVHWQVLFWLLGIHTTNLRRYSDVLPELVASLTRKYFSRRRMLLCRSMLICFKHRRWDRVAEGLAIWRESDDPLLQTVGKLFGNKDSTPDWYHKHNWVLARIEDCSLRT